MKEQAPASAERALILAPRGRDAVVAKGILRDARIRSDICLDLAELLQEIGRGADVAIVTEEATRGSDMRGAGALGRHSRRGRTFRSSC